LRQLENTAHSSGQSQLFIETPYRNPALWQALMTHLKGSTRVSMASGLTLPQAHIECHDVQTWRHKNHIPAKDVPTVFAIGV
jgi:16S rRNA (cytidine1402-2'-O)-methyltransferase